MKKAGIVTIGVIALLFAAGAYAMNELLPSGSWRYKITILVDTPEGIKSGFAVREVFARRNPKVTMETLSHVSVKGEAVVVDLGKRGVLFGLMDTNGSYDVVFKTFPGPPGLTVEGIQYYRNLKGVKAPSKVMPQLVRFKDLNDPLTVEAVDYRNLSASFGEGVALKEITVEMVDEPVTAQIEKWLPWLLEIKSNIDGTSATISGNLSNRLHRGNFIKGNK